MHRNPPVILNLLSLQLVPLTQVHGLMKRRRNISVTDSVISRADLLQEYNLVTQTKLVFPSYFKSPFITKL